MVRRRTKLVAAGAVLAVGFALAWPMRRSGEPDPAPAASPVVAAQPPRETPTGPTRLEFSGATASAPAAESAPPVSPTPLVDPLAASLAPATAAALPSAAEPPAAAAPGPVYTTIADVVPSDDAPPAGERLHVIHDGDTLERLAKRYLGDESRAVEIFDLNQDVLANPHVLKIGVELRIPPTAAAP